MPIKKREKIQEKVLLGAELKAEAAVRDKMALGAEIEIKEQWRKVKAKLQRKSTRFQAPFFIFLNF